MLKSTLLASAICFAFVSPAFSANWTCDEASLGELKAKLALSDKKDEVELGLKDLEAADSSHESKQHGRMQYAYGTPRGRRSAWSSWSWTTSPGIGIVITMRFYPASILMSSRRFGSIASDQEVHSVLVDHACHESSHS